MDNEAIIKGRHDAIFDTPDNQSLKELLAKPEEEFDISIPDKKIKELVTVGAVMKCIEELSE